MANSKYEYVKEEFELGDEVFFPNLMILRIDGRDFSRFSQVHEFEKPNDLTAVNLMNSCSSSVMEKYPDIVFAYGYSDEYSFVFNKTSRFYQRRASKILSVVTSIFTSLYVTKWKEFFPERELQYAPSFTGKVISCATSDVLQAYLSWRQKDCHDSNQYNTCLWASIRNPKVETITESQEDYLKKTTKQDRNDLLYGNDDDEYRINYKSLPQIFRQGSCLFKREVKHDENGNPVKRMKRTVVLEHSENIAGISFWNNQVTLCNEIGRFTKDLTIIDHNVIRSFELENKLLPSTWIVVRIDGCHFHKFSDEHEFEKPNDVRALNLMNTCAVAVLQEFKDIRFAYGVSDEFSFVLKKDSELYGRQSSQIVSAITSLFSSSYVMKWSDFFPEKELNYPSSFDGRAVLYPDYKILLDYLAWRQVDCHINNQYNTCFWMLVKSGVTKAKSQERLEKTVSQEKNELLLTQFGIKYDSLPSIFRRGSSVFRLKEAVGVENGLVEGQVVVEHCNIIEPSFWEANPHILQQAL